MRKSSMKLLAGAAALLANLSASAAEVHVLAAASLTDALREVAVTYGKQSADRIVFNFGASSTLARQIEEGAPADVFFSADEAGMDALERNGRIVKSSRRSRLSNSLVVIVAVDSPLVVTAARDLTNQAFGRIALADPRAVPAGVYAKAYFEKLKLWTLIEPKVVPTGNVRGALAVLESGNVEAAMVYKTDAAVSGKVKVAYEVPRAEGPEISYPMALVADAGQPEAAGRFLRFLDSAQAGEVFGNAGFVILQPRD